MATIADLLVKIGADTTEFQNELKAVQRQLKNTFGTQGMAASSKALGILTGIGASITALGTASVYTAAKLQNVTTAFEAMTGSATKTKALVADLQAFAAKTTIDFTTASEAAKKFLAMGYKAEQIVPTLNAVADAAAGIGMSKAQINKVTTTLAKMGDQTNLTNANMTALIRSGLPAWDMLAKAMGTDVTTAMEKVSKGAIDACDGISMLLNQMQSDYAGAMEKKAATLTGAWATVTTGFEQVMGQVGLKINDAFDVTGVLQKVGDTLVEFGKVVATSGISEALRTVIPPEFSATVVAIGTTITGVAIPAIVMLATKVAALAAPFVAAVSAAAPFIAAAAAVAAGLYLMWQKGIGISDVLNAMGVDMGAVNKLFSSAKELVGKLKDSFATLYDKVSPVVDLLGTGLAMALSLALKQLGLWVDTLVGMATVAVEIVNDLVDGFNWLLDKVTGIFSSIGDVFSNMANRLLPDWAKSCLSTVSDFVSGAASKLKGFFNLTTDVNKSIADVASEAADGANKSVASIDFSNLRKEIKKTEETAEDSQDNLKKKTDTTQAALLKSAQNVNKSLMDEWNKVFTTRIDQADKWYEDEKKVLEDSKEQNANYEKDLERLEDLYRYKRISAVVEEAKAIRDAREKALNASYTNQQTYSLFGSDGEQQIKKMEIEYEQACDAIRKRWQTMSDEYVTLSKDGQKAYLEALDKEFIAYKETGDGRLSFEIMIQEELAAKEEEYNRKKLQMEKSFQKEKADIQQAYNELNMDNLQKLLTQEYALEVSHNDAKKELMETYEQAFMDSHLTILELIANLNKEALGGLETAFSDILTGAEEAKAAFQTLGKAMLKVIADYFAKMMAGMVMSAVLGKQQDAEAVAETAANAASAAAAWGPAAWEKLVVSPGAGPAATAMLSSGTSSAATLGAASVAALGAFKIPGSAKGGLFTHPMLSILGDGPENEVALPLNKSVFESIAHGIVGESDSAAGGTVNATQNVYGDINNASDLDDLWDGFTDLIAAGIKGY